MNANLKGLNVLQKISLTFMSVMVLLTFIGANLHALLWQSSEWLVSTVLPAVVVQLTNDERVSNSAVPLQRNTTLDQAAKLKAEHMAKNEYFSHFSPDGVSPWHWFNEAGYVYAHAGENLAIHFTDSSEVVDAWMDSPTHRKNIVNGLYTEIGVGTAKGKFDGYNTVYVVQLFGTPAVPPAIVATPTPLAVSNSVVVPELVPAPNPKELVAPVVDELVVTETTLEAELAIAPAGQEPVLAASDAGPEDSSETLVAKDIVLLSEASVPASPDVAMETDTLLSESVLEVSTETNSVVITSPVFATSSGLAIAQVDTNINTPSTADRLASIATQPNTLLQFVYSILALAVVMMLGASIVQGARKFNYQQVAYGFLLLFGMGGLWFMHSLLTVGAVVT
jgi:hypothetical protein